MSRELKMLDGMWSVCCDIGQQSFHLGHRFVQVAPGGFNVIFRKGSFAFFVFRMQIYEANAYIGARKPPDLLCEKRIEPHLKVIAIVWCSCLPIDDLTDIS